MTKNKYLETYIDSYVSPFHGFFKDHTFTVKIKGLANFIPDNNQDVHELIGTLSSYGFDISLTAGEDNLELIQVEYSSSKEKLTKCFDYSIDNLISIDRLAGLTNISVEAIMIMQIISRVIYQNKVLYKAIILDLDDTLWKGTLAEDGIETIKQNLSSNDAAPFLSLMNFIKVLAQESGLFVAICSRNDPRMVSEALDALTDKEFPIKGQIDCIIANYNDKSLGIKEIANKLSILTSSCVFIDDNQIVRDEVREHLPEVFVPEWSSHDELLTLLEASCVLDRFELSLKARIRKHTLSVLQQERQKHSLPNMPIITHADEKNSEARRLYIKSNQFKFNSLNDFTEPHQSVYFEILRPNSESLGICAAVTYRCSDNGLHISNWAISCRFFGIGLEEFILLYLIKLASGGSICFDFLNTGDNLKASELIEHYAYAFRNNPNTSGNLVLEVNNQFIEQLKTNTNLRGIQRG